MNKQRRTEIRKINDIRKEMSERLGVVASDEEFAFDNMPDGISESDRGAEMEEGLEELQDIYGELDELIERLEEFYE